MDTLKRFAILSRKEWSDLWQQRVFVINAALAPFFIFFCFYLIWSFDVTVPVEVANQGGAAGEAFIRAMQSIQTPFGGRYIAVKPISSDLPRRAAGEYMVTVEIPAGFGQERDRQHQYPLVVHYGAVQENSVKNYINRLHEAESRFLIEQHLGFTPIRVDEQRRYPSDPPVRQAMAVGIMAMALLLAGGIFGGVILAREYEDKTIKLIRVSPASRLLLLLSKGNAAFWLTLLAAAVYVLAGAGLLAGAWPVDGGLFLVNTLLLACLGVLMGMLLGMALRGSVPVFITILIASLTMWLLGGGFGSLALYSPLHQRIVQILPFTHGMNLFWYSYFGGGSEPVHTSLAWLTGMLAAALLLLGYTTHTIFEKEK